MKVPGVPDDGVLKPVDAHQEPATGSDAHAGDEEMIVRPKQKESRVTIAPKPLAVLPYKALNLGLRETKLFRVFRKRPEHLGERGVFHHLVNSDASFHRSHSRLVSFPVLEIRVNVGKHIVCLNQGLRTVDRVNGKILAAGNEPQKALATETPFHDQLQIVGHFIGIKSPFKNSALDFPTPSTDQPERAVCDNVLHRHNDNLLSFIRPILTRRIHEFPYFNEEYMIVAHLY